MGCAIEWDSLQGEIAHSLELLTLTRCSRWAEKVRHIDGNPWSFQFHPWLRSLHDDDNETIVIQKAAQMGFTEYALNRTLYVLDQLRKDVLYALPNERPSAVNFSRGRINAASAQSPYINQLFRLSKNENHKITKHYCNLYIRGARSRTGFKEVPVSLVVLDELDEMQDEAIELARYRLMGQKDYKQLIMLSTPSHEGRGIAKQYQETSQARFFFPCPHCSKHIELTYPDCLVVQGESITDPSVSESYLRCPKCHHRLNHSAKSEWLAKGEWVHAYPTRPERGYTINQLYSCAASPAHLAQQELRGRISLQSKIEFYNSSLGLTYTPKGSRITDQILNECQGREYFNNTLGEAKNHLVTMGVDVGQETHHLVVCGFKLDASMGVRDIVAASTGKVLLFKTIKEWKELDALMQEWRPERVVFDAQPEARQVKLICKRWGGRAYMCYYSLQKADRELVLGNVNEHSVSVNRTYWLDASLGKILNKSMLLPRDIDLDFRTHMKCLLKTYTTNDLGEVKAEYIKKQNEEDHYAHAYNYSIIALGLLSGHGPNEVIN